MDHNLLRSERAVLRLFGASKLHARTILEVKGFAYVGTICAISRTSA
jgi:hypothetical protein